MITIFSFATGELGRRLVSAAEGGGALNASALASVREQWEGWAEGAGLVTRDLAYLNDDIDLYNLQVQRLPDIDESISNHEFLLLLCGNCL
jgi:hypothetical protein